MHSKQMVVPQCGSLGFGFLFFIFKEGLHLPDVFMVSCLAYIFQQIVDYIAINQVILASLYMYAIVSFLFQFSTSYPMELTASFVINMF